MTGYQIQNKPEIINSIVISSSLLMIGVLKYGNSIYAISIISCNQTWLMIYWKSHVICERPKMSAGHT